MKRIPRRGLAALLSLLLAGQLCPLAPAASPDVPITEDVFPDPVFRQWLTDPANLDGAGTDGVFTPEELADIRSINVASLGISSLEGIEVFSALEELSCKNNGLTELDVRHNAALEYLQCDYNRIAHLDVSGLARLKSLYCEHNRMDTLNLDGCTALETIYCRSNDLEEVDFSTNTNLKFIESFDNKLTEVDLSMLPQLEFVHLDHNRLTHLDLSRNPSLTGIGSGFVARNNHLEALTLPNRPGQTVDWDVYKEQDPKEGFERVEWYYDPQYTQPVEELTPADGRTLYAKWLPNDYTIRFDAAGGFGSMDPVAAVWDSPVTLPAQTFRRTGYTFDCWKNTYGDGARYQDGAQVTNLGGKIQGDKVTLYAQWSPITYTVSFDAGSGSGSMAPQTLTYDRDMALPACTLTAPAGLEFAGWSRTPGGPVAYRDQAAVRNLTAVQGETVTLYAVWATPVLHQYLERLDSALARYDDTDYTAQDRAALEAVYRQASQALLSAGDEGEMARICVGAEQDLAAVPSLSARAQTVLTLWRQANGQVLALVDRAAVDESNAAEIAQSVQALSGGPDAAFVAGYTDLTSSADQTLVADLALSGTRGDLEALDRLEKAAAWAAGLDGLSLRPMAQVTSQTLDAYEAARAQSADHAAQLTPALTAALEERTALARCKQQSVKTLLSAYQSYDLTQYTDAARSQLDAIWRQGTADVEAAASETEATAVLDKAVSDLRAVPVKTPETQPGGGASGGGGGGGGGGGAGGGSGEPVTPPDQTPPAWTNPYTDVSKSDWFYDSVAYVSANNIMNGYADGTFAPGRNLSRAQLAQLLYNLEGRPASAAVRYTDTQPGAWYESAVSWAAQAGILTGYADGSIRPNNSVTRQQFAAMLYRYARYAGRDVSRRADLSGYTDARQIAPYALEAMQWANAAGILNGSGGALLPGGTATRAQTAAMLTRLCTGKA